jgi:four helix bundle protein
MKDFRTLLVWRKAHEVSLAVYRATMHFPSDEKFGMTSQVRRSCVSIEANIAEGCGRDGDQEFRRFLCIAMGSATELDCHLLLARDLELLTPDQYQPLSRQLTEVKSMLAVLIRKIENSSDTGNHVRGRTRGIS